MRRLSAKELAVGSFKAYDHGAFRVSCPENWQIVGERNSSLTMYPKGGADQETVVYGTIISVFSPGRSSKELADAMRQLISSIRDTNPALRQTGNPVNLTVGGRPAKTVEMLGNSALSHGDKPVPERIRLVGIQGQGNVILYMVFVAPDDDFDKLCPTFDRIRQSFAPK